MDAKIPFTCVGEIQTRNVLFKPKHKLHPTDTGRVKDNPLYILLIYPGGILNTYSRTEVPKKKHVYDFFSAKAITT